MGRGQKEFDARGRAAAARVAGVTRKLALMRHGLARARAFYSRPGETLTSPGRVLLNHRDEVSPRRFPFLSQLTLHYHFSFSAKSIWKNLRAASGHLDGKNLCYSKEKLASGRATLCLTDYRDI